MSPEKESPEEKEAFESLLEFMKTNRNFDFTGYKRSSLMRRVTKRMHSVDIESFSEYQDYLEVHPGEFLELFNTILINVTCFFRDPGTWDFLAQETIPWLLERKGEYAPVRAWSVGTASGEEAYTLAMVLAEALGKDQFIQRVKIYATDVDEEAITVARHAVYSREALDSVPAELRKKYFQPANGRFQFKKELRRSVIFGVHDVVQAAPISRLDILTCRNTLMYFNLETQSKILGRFHFALNDYGILFLGMAETMLTRDRFYEPLNQKYRIFKKLPMSIRNHGLIFANAGDEQLATGMRHQLSEAIFQNSPFAQLIVDADGTLTMANAEAISMFNLQESDIGGPFYELQVSYRPKELRPVIQEVISQNRPTHLTNVERVLPDNSKRYADVYIVPLSERLRETAGVAIFFIDVTRYQVFQREAEKSGIELEHANEELQSTSEELETTNEELQSTVEELETANEELQSSNEEMETMNEELQATNEELQTINDELRERTDELNDMNAFRESILSSAPLGIVVLDRRLSILTWNKRSEKLWGLPADEVAGQFFLNLDIGLPVERMKNPLRAVLEKKKTGKLKLDGRDRRGKAISVDVTCTPLMGQDKEVAGVVLLMEGHQKDDG